MQQTISHADSGEKHLCLLLLLSPFNQLKRLQLIWKNIKHATGYTVEESTCTSKWGCLRHPSICYKDSSWFGRALDSGKDYFLLRFTKKVGMRELWLRTHLFKSKFKILKHQMFICPAKKMFWNYKDTWHACTKDPSVGVKNSSVSLGQHQLLVRNHTAGLCPL